MKNITDKHMENLIGHTCLSPTTTNQIVQEICENASAQAFGSILTTGIWASFCRTKLTNKNVKIGVVCGFPFGTSSTATKIIEVIDALENGADEIAFVLNTAAVLSDDYQAVENEMLSMYEVTKGNSQRCSILVETSLLTRSHLLKVIELAKIFQFHFFIPATGFSKNSVSLRRLRLIKRNLGDKLPLWVLTSLTSKAQVAEFSHSGVKRISSLQAEMGNPKSW